MKQQTSNLPDIRIAEFEGPLDLLLHLIRKAQMNIYDIKVSEITSQYLDYLHSQQSLKLNIAGEYLVMAAKLTEIKGKMLLPHDEETEEVEDPRTDLVDQLLEYQMFKEASESLKELEQQRQTSFGRPESEGDPAKLNHLAPGIELSDLKAALQKVLARQALFEPKTKTVKNDEVSIEERMTQISSKIRKIKQCSFGELFKDHFTKANIVTTFIAILELAKKHEIFLEQDQPKTDIIISVGDENE